MKLRILFLLITLTLTACNSSGVKSEAPQQASDQSSAQPAESAVKPERKVTTKPMQPQGGSVANQTEPNELTGRLTAVQEQLLQIKTQTAQMNQQNQALFIHIQSIKDAIMSMQTPEASPETANAPADAEAFNGVLDQLTLVANQLGNSVEEGPYKVTSAYTAKGQWVLIRYNRFTGQSWLADQGQWNLLEENGATGRSDYEVVVLRADNDVKGYVAARLDTVNGDAWWLRQDIWQPFVTN